jgi:hypothetical protein
MRQSPTLQQATDGVQTGPTLAPVVPFHCFHRFTNRFPVVQQLCDSPLREQNTSPVAYPVQIPMAGFSGPRGSVSTSSSGLRLGLPGRLVPFLPSSMDGLLWASKRLPAPVDDSPIAALLMLASPAVPFLSPMPPPDCTGAPPHVLSPLASPSTTCDCIPRPTPACSHERYLRFERLSQTTSPSKAQWGNLQSSASCTY